MTKFNLKTGILSAFIILVVMLDSYHTRISHEPTKEVAEDF